MVEKKVASKEKEVDSKKTEKIEAKEKETTQNAQ